MDDKFTEYLRTLEIGGPVTSNVDEIMGVFELVTGKTPEEIFVSEYKAKSGERIIENLWMFSGNILSEASGISAKKDLDFLSLEKLNYFKISWADFDFKTPTIESRLSVHTHMNDEELTGNFKATALNCGHLWKIYNSYLLPHSVFK